MPLCSVLIIHVSGIVTLRPAMQQRRSRLSGPRRAHPKAVLALLSQSAGAEVGWCTRATHWVARFALNLHLAASG